MPLNLCVPMRRQHGKGKLSIKYMDDIEFLSIDIPHGYYKLWIGDFLYIVQTITIVQAGSGGSRHQVHNYKSSLLHITGV